MQEGLQREKRNEEREGKCRRPPPAMGLDCVGSEEKASGSAVSPTRPTAMLSCRTAWVGAANSRGLTSKDNAVSSSPWSYAP